MMFGMSVGSLDLIFIFLISRSLASIISFIVQRAKGSLDTLVRGVSCEVKVTGLSYGIGH